MACALEAETSLTQLGLWGNGVSSEGAAQVACALEADTTLTHLNLGNNSVGDEGATQVPRTLEGSTILAQLDLWDKVCCMHGTVTILSLGKVGPEGLGQHGLSVDMVGGVCCVLGVL